jgi:hypothetical protein
LKNDSFFSGDVMAYTSDEEYEQAIRSLRRDVDVDERFCPDVIFALNRLVEKHRIEYWQVLPKQQIGGEAWYDSGTKTVTLSTNTFAALDNIANTSKVERRTARFTVAHELAHYSQGHLGRHYRGHSSANIVVRSRMRMNEGDANRFAAAFLTPFHLVLQVVRDQAVEQLSVEDISDIFDVSLRVARIRKPVLERMYRRLKNEPRLLPNVATGLLEQLQRDSGRPLESLKIDEDRRRQIAKSKGYEDKRCERCKNFTLRRQVDALTCETCEKPGGKDD